MATFNDGASALLLTQPFFATLLLRLKHIPDATMPTLAVGDGELRYSEVFLSGLSLDTVVWCVAHEVLHAALCHCERLKHFIALGIGPDGKPFDARQYNAALDYVVNATLDDAGIGTAWEHALLDKTRFPATMTPEEVYCELAKGSKGNGRRDAMDAHVPSDMSLPPQAVIQAANMARKCGGLPPAIERLVGGITKPKTHPWAMLRQCVTRMVRGAGSTSWRKLHRVLARRGIGAPGSVAGCAGHVVVVVDVSGSIDADMLSLFAGHMAAIIDVARPQRVTVLWVDTAVRREDVVKSGAALRQALKAKVPGGGLTDMPAGVARAEELSPDVCVVLTDGYTPFCASTIPVVWAITTAGKSSPYGVSLNIGGA